MTLRQPHQDGILAAEEITMIRRTLSTCAKVLEWAERHGGPDYRQALTEASHAAGLSRSPSGLAYDLSLAIGYLDVMPAAWKNQ